MYACILIVGGGLANFSGVEELVRQRVLAAIPQASRMAAVARVEVLTKPKVRSRCRVHAI